MALQRYGFIVKSADLEMFKHHSRLASENFDMSISGVQDVAQAELVAQEMITKGIQLIELCGGFSADDAKRIREAINDHIPVGYVQYTDEERSRLQRELA
jgi:phosphoribosylformylglycinamidine (FGAM) synthase-like amidotransferase family enzyme